MKDNHFKGQTIWETMPKKVDLTDRKITYLLCNNSRLSNTAIGKALKLKREVVSYRIKRMLENEFLFGFVSRINPRKLGLLIHFLNLKLKNPSKEQEIIAYLEAKNEISGLKNTSGRFDLWTEITSKNIEELDSIVAEILNKYGHLIQEYKITQIVEEIPMDVSILLEDKESQKLRELKERKGSSFQKELEMQKRNNEKVELDELDKDILNFIKLDARMNLKDLAQKTESSPAVINNRIKKMVQEGVIKTFTSYFSLSSLGYQMFQVLMQVRNHNEPEFLTFVNAHPNILWTYKMIGEWNYQVNIFALNNAHLHEVLNDLRNRFSDNIVSYDTSLVFNILKLEQRVK